MRFTAFPILAAVPALLALATGPVLATEDLNLLTWCDHTDPELFAAFEEANDVRVNVKVYELTGAAESLLAQSAPGDWDVFVVDTADVVRLAGTGLLAPLDDADLPLDNLFEGARMDGHHVVDGVRYAVPEKFGFNTISYDETRFGDEDAISLRDLFDPAYEGRVAVYDYYWPIMLQLGQMNGIAPDAFSIDDLDTIRDDLFALKEQSVVVGDIVSTQTALSTGDAVALLGQGEWVAAVAEELPNLSWTVPEEGGIRWSQSLALFEGSKRKELGLALIDYLMSPEGQAKLATASCYWGFPASREAALAEDTAARLGFDRTEAFLDAARPFPAYDPELDAAMIALWTEFLAQ